MTQSARSKKKFKDTLVRLQKYLAECGVASRRKSEELILDGKVAVNGKIVTTLGTKVDPSKDMVRVRKKIIKPEEKGIILLNKPRHVVSTMDDPEGRPTVADFLTSKHRSYFPVGRLDWDTMGLMILTNDGEMADLLMHPRNEFQRIYEAKVAGIISDKTYEKLKQGVYIDADKITCNVRQLEVGKDYTWLEIIVAEGRNHLVRKLMEKVLHPVQKLKRVAYGPFKIGKLEVGHIRKLTLGEYIRYRFKVLNHRPGKFESY